VRKRNRKGGKREQVRHRDRKLTVRGRRRIHKEQHSTIRRGKTRAGARVCEEGREGEKEEKEREKEGVKRHHCLEEEEEKEKKKERLT
jgi:hypothetical protein